MLTYLDGRKKDHEDRVVGALRFFNWTMAASQGLDAELYRPKLNPGEQPDRWRLSGILVVRQDESVEPQDRGGRLPFTAELESVCDYHGSPQCWRLATLVIDGKTLIAPEPAPSETAAVPAVEPDEASDTARIEAVEAPDEDAAEETARVQDAPTEEAAFVEAAVVEAEGAEEAVAASAPAAMAGTAAALLPLPKDPASRALPEFPPAPWITVARPHQNLPLLADAQLPCIGEAAWRDPDILRNRQLILHETLCLSVLEFTENDLNWRVQVFDSGRPGYNWVVLHDDEDAAFDAGLYAIARYGGKMVDVDLLPPTPFSAFVDPNHNFAFVDSHRLTCEGPPRRAAPIFTTTIVKLLGPPPYLALHNNYDGHYLGGGGGNISVQHSTQGLFGLPAKMTGERLADEDNFILVSGLAPPDRLSDRLRDTIDQLRYSGVNVIYEHVQPATYDCSLSNFLLLHGGIEPGQYFNVESELGDYRSQVTMIDALVGTLDSPLRVSH